MESSQRVLDPSGQPVGTPISPNYHLPREKGRRKNLVSFVVESSCGLEMGFGRVLDPVDNKKKIGKPDRNLISFKEKYEVDYAIKQLQKQFPDESKQAVKNALFKAAKKVEPSEGREKIMRQARKDLRN